MNKLIQWLVIIAMPLLLGFTTFRLSISDLYPRWEYGKADFPPDPYGFSPQQREALALVAVNYLRLPQPAEEVIYLLEEQTLPDSDQPLYNPQEISHMLDVKRVADSLIRPLSWIGIVVVGGGLFWLLGRSPSRKLGYQALFGGGLFTTLLLLAIGGFILIGWNTFFVTFHDLLFPPGTWTFPMSDSLIRLFPERFWFDYGVILTSTILAEAVLVTGIGYLLSKR